MSVPILTDGTAMYVMTVLNHGTVIVKIAAKSAVTAHGKKTANTHKPANARVGGFMTATMTGTIADMAITRLSVPIVAGFVMFVLMHREEQSMDTVNMLDVIRLKAAMSVVIMRVVVCVNMGFV